MVLLILICIPVGAKPGSDFHKGFAMGNVCSFYFILFLFFVFAFVFYMSETSIPATQDTPQIQLIFGNLGKHFSVHKE